ncbi:putative ATP-dependent DNA helicase [Phytophthora infestans]|uniref:Putative ATP-dependent DNA helicase n=1 Tax=Phytophthora infestans TaxID=4787 RepID=A0A833T9I8_PHYIN|nr:putative ATP-dependent DNA helicase [Phytophthora infestans]KAF4137170.1 putative ATP-dependent DNA helicase [Phytophthora infestans]
MRRVLGPKAWTTSSIRDYYNCGAIDNRLTGMLLSPRGVEHTDNGVQIWMSRDVLRHLRALDAKLILCESIKDELVPPRFAIADCFVAGTFSKIDATTLIGRQAVGLVQTRGIVKVVYGGPGNVLQSHLISWDNRHATIASRAPSVRTCNDFRVVLAGPMTPEHELVVAKQHECNGARVHALQMLLRRINPLYKDIDESFKFDNGDQSRDFFCTGIGKNEDNAGLVARARARQQTVAAPSDINSAAADETSILPTET